jgi:hypothetical protein
LTVGKDIGERVQVYKSDDSGIVVEDYKDEQEDVFRSVVFTNKPEQVQSEVQLAYKNSKKVSIQETLKAQSKLAPKKKQKTLVFNFDHLSSEY